MPYIGKKVIIIKFKELLNNVMDYHNLIYFELSVLQYYSEVLRKVK
jgi:hypothetical protein